MNLNIFLAGAATQPAAAKREIAKLRPIARRTNAAGVQIPGLKHLNGGGKGSTGLAQGGQKPFIFGAGSGPQQPIGFGQALAEGQSFNFGMGAQQQLAPWPQPTPVQQAPPPAPAPAPVVPVSAPVQPAPVSAPAPTPTQLSPSEPVHDPRFDQEQVSDAEDDEDVAPAARSTQGALAFVEPNQDDPSAGRLLKRDGKLDHGQKEKLNGCIRAGVSTVVKKKVRGAGPAPFGMTLMQANRTSAALKKLLEESCETGPLDDAIEVFISDVFWNFDTAGTGESVPPQEGHEPILFSTFYIMCVANIKTYMKACSTLRNTFV